MADEVEDFINGGASNNLPSFKFTNVGDTILGTVTRRDVREVNDLRTPGQKVKQLILEVKTDKEYSQPGKDKDGQPIVNTGTEWSVWIKSPSQMLTALADALKAGGARAGAPHPGDRIAVSFEKLEPSKTVGFSPKKVYTVAYKPAPSAAAAESSSGAVTVDDL